MTKVRVLLAEDHKMMREGLRVVVNREASLEVVGEADNGFTTIALAQDLQPDVVVMDVSMPRLNGLKATEALQALVPEARVLILTRHSEMSYVQQLFRSGARGYVLKQSASAELVRAIHRVAAGNTYLDPLLAEEVVDSVASWSDDMGSSRKILSKREQDVLRCVALGFLSKEIAARLEISIKTVETHKANAMSKLRLNSRVDIVRYALLRGWLQDT